MYVCLCVCFSYRCVCVCVCVLLRMRTLYFLIFSIKTFVFLLWAHMLVCAMVEFFLLFMHLYVCMCQCVNRFASYIQNSHNSMPTPFIRLDCSLSLS